MAQYKKCPTTDFVVPFIRFRIKRLYDICTDQFYDDVECRLRVRLFWFADPKFNPFGCSRIKLFGHIWAVWASERVPSLVSNA